MAVRAYFRRRVPLAFLMTALVAPASGLAVVSHVDSEQKLSDTAGGFGGTLVDFGEFGVAVAGIGDLDDDGVEELAVGALDDTGGTGAVWILFMNANGTVASEAKIDASSTALAGALDPGDMFGASLVGLGDHDGDGVEDIAVGAIGDDDHPSSGSDTGAVYVLFLATDGSVSSAQKISALSGGLVGTVAGGDRFGAAVARLGDLDGDGVKDIAVGASGDDAGATDAGALWVLRLDAGGNVNGESRIDDANLPGSPLDSGDQFGFSAAGIGDLDGDGVEDVAVGALGADSGSTDAGAVYVLNLDSSGGVVAASAISDVTGSFSGTLDSLDAFGRSVALVATLDGGVIQLAVGARGDDDGGVKNRGASWVLSLNPSGQVIGWFKVSQTSGGFGGTLASNDGIGTSTGVADLDGDGRSEILLGGSGDDDGGTNRGAVWVLFLDPGLVLADYRFEFEIGVDRPVHPTVGVAPIIDVAPFRPGVDIFPSGAFRLPALPAVAGTITGPFGATGTMSRLSYSVGIAAATSAALCGPSSSGFHSHTWVAVQGTGCAANLNGSVKLTQTGAFPGTPFSHDLGNLFGMTHGFNSGMTTTNVPVTWYATAEYLRTAAAYVRYRSTSASSAPILTATSIGDDQRTPDFGGQLNLVAPVAIRTHIAGGGSGQEAYYPSFARLQLRFAPEPGVGALLLGGSLLLALLGQRRSSSANNPGKRDDAGSENCRLPFGGPYADGFRSGN